MSIVKEYLKKTAEKINKPTLTRSQVNKVFQKPLPKTVEEYAKIYEKSNAEHLHYQTLMIVGINMAIDKSKHIFNFTEYRDRGLVSSIGTTLTKLKKSFMSRLTAANGDYNTYLEEATTFVERLCTLGFGIKPVNRNVMLVYTSKIASWLNAVETQKKHDFIWVTYDTATVTEYSVFGETVEVQHKGVPDNYERVILHTVETTKWFEPGKGFTTFGRDGIVCYYDSEKKRFLIDEIEGSYIEAKVGMKWLSYDFLTKTL